MAISLLQGIFSTSNFPGLKPIKFGDGKMTMDARQMPDIFHYHKINYSLYTGEREKC